MKICISLLISIILIANGIAQTPADLVPLSGATHTAVATGSWSSNSTWGGAIPSNDAKVVIPNGITVTVDGEFFQRIKTLRIDGKLQFQQNINTELKVETIIGLMGSELEIGTAANPIQNGVTSKITFIDEGPIDLNWDYGQFSKGMVFMGTAKIYGFEKTAFTTLAVQPAAGANALTLSTVPIGWQVNDEIVITGTDPFNPSSDEKRTITAISGNSVTLNNPLTLNHIALTSNLDIHVANLSRNIIISSENAAIDRRGHIMFMHTTNVDMHNARTHQLGRTNKRVQIDDWFFPNLDGEDAIAGARTNIRGRYSIHFHRGGVSPNNTPVATVKGCVVEDDAGWAYVNHSSYVDFLDNVSYNVVGGAFQTEAGDEIGSFKRNIAIRTVNPDFPLLNPSTSPVDIREDSQDFAFQGDAYWLHGGRITVDNNIASGASGHGFIYWTEGLREADTGISANIFSAVNLPNGQHLPNGSCNTWWAPLVSFKGNVAYSCTKGFQSLYIHSTLFDDYEDLTPDYYATVHSILEDMTIWNVQLAAMDLSHNERVTFKNWRIENDYSLNPNAIGITTEFMCREHVYDNVSVKGFVEGFKVPTRGNVTILGGTWSNETDFIIDPVQIANMPYYTRDLRFECVEFEPSLYFTNTANFDMRGSSYFDGVAVTNSEDIARQFMLPDRITIDTDQYGSGRLYYDEQAANYIPITPNNILDASGTQFENDVINKTNQQLQNSYGLSFAGAILPNDAVAISGVSGGKLSQTDTTPMNFSVCAYSNDSFLNYLPDQFDNFDFFSCWAGFNTKADGVVNTYSHNQCTPVSTNVDLELSIDCMKLHPNPTAGFFSIGGDFIDYTIQILDANGTVYQNLSNQSSPISIDISSLPAGLYFINVSNSNNSNLCIQHIIKM